LTVYISARLSLDWIKTINAQALQPDICIFIDVPPEKVIERLQRKKSVMEPLETQQKVRDVYMKYLEKGELVRVDGDKEVVQVAEELFKTVSGLIEAAQKYV
jgi:thymidylate kinase